MNLFRSEEHVRNWSRYRPDTAQGIVPLANIAELFSGDLFRQRLTPDYVSRMPEYWSTVLGILGEMAKERPFWTPPSAATSGAARRA